MAKVVKIPLVMKNGEKVTDMKSLIANFDVESVVGYFLDGKLAKWLNDRYYEDEAEAIAKIEKDDPTLAKQLCEIFCVEYEAAEEIDAEEIALKNERLAHLKQITDDEEVLQNIDAVAFNQEELAVVYDKGLERIYLCEGEFRIPKSKQNLEYFLIGAASATGLPIEKPIAEEIEVSPKFESCSINNIPEMIADKIEMNLYACLDDYIVYYKDGGLFNGFLSLRNEPAEGPYKVWNRHTGKETSFDIPEFSSVSIIKASGNHILVTDKWESGIILYDVASAKKTIICTDYSDKSGFSVYGNSIAYTNSDDQLFVYNISSKTKQKVTDLNYTLGGQHFILCGNYLFYHNTTDDTFCVYDVGAKTKAKLFDMENHLILQSVSHNEKVFLLMHSVYDNYVALWSIALGEAEGKPIEHFRFNTESSYGLEHQKQIAPYFIYVKAEYGFPVYAFNMITQELTQVTTECGHTYREDGGLFKKTSTTYFTNNFQIVGDYLYFEREDSEVCRVNLSDPDKAIKIME